MPGQGSDVAVTVKSELLRIVEDIKKIAAEQDKLSTGLEQATESVGKTIDENTKKVKTSFQKMKEYGKSVGKSLQDDFKALFSLNAVGGALKLSDQFKGSVKETVELGDNIRRLGSTFGIAQGKFAAFQARITKGLGAIGLSSDVASRSLEGLSETPVRGEENLIGYTKLAGELASISGTKGTEGGIAKGIANVLISRGANPNDMKAAAAVAEDLRRVQNATGRKPQDTLNSMSEMFAGMDQAMRKQVSTRGLANLAAVAHTAGPNSTKFLEEFMKAGSIGRQRFEAQGFKGVIGNNGLNTEQFRQSGGAIMNRIRQDPRMAAQTLGISEEAAEGFVRLYESLDRVKKAQDEVNESTGSLSEQYETAKGMEESFKGSINRVKGFVAGPLSEATQGLTELLGKASHSDLGSAAVVGGGAIAAAVLAGGGLRGLGKSILGDTVKTKISETVSGKEASLVEVTNWPEGLEGGGMLEHGAKAAAGTGALATAAIVGAGAAVTAAGAMAIAPIAAEHFMKETDKGKQPTMDIPASERGASAGGNAIADALIAWLNKGKEPQKQEVTVELKGSKVREVPQPGRGR